MYEFIREIMEEQIKRETNISNDIKEFLELKYRKVNEHVNKKWDYKKQDKHAMEPKEEQPLRGIIIIFNVIV